MINISLGPLTMDLPSTIFNKKKNVFIIQEFHLLVIIDSKSIHTTCI
jgi:hypothetical protein